MTGVTSLLIAGGPVTCAWLNPDSDNLSRRTSVYFEASFKSNGVEIFVIKTPPMARWKLILESGITLEAPSTFDSSSVISVGVAFLKFKRTVSVPSVFSLKPAASKASAEADPLFGIVSEVVRC